MQQCAGFISAECCIKLVFHLTYTMMHGFTKLKCITLFPALIRRCDDLPATITHVPVAAVLVLNTPDDGRLRPKRVE